MMGFSQGGRGPNTSRRAVQNRRRLRQRIAENEGERTADLDDYRQSTAYPNEAEEGNNGEARGTSGRRLVVNRADASTCPLGRVQAPAANAAQFNWPKWKVFDINHGQVRVEWTQIRLSQAS